MPQQCTLTCSSSASASPELLARLLAALTRPKLKAPRLSLAKLAPLALLRLSAIAVAATVLPDPGTGRDDTMGVASVSRCSAVVLQGGIQGLAEEVRARGFECCCCCCWFLPVGINVLSKHRRNIVIIHA